MIDSFVKGFTLFLLLISAVAAQEQWNWVERESGTTRNLHAAAWGDSAGLFVAVGDSGTIITSPDGVEWTARSSGTDAALASVVWGKDKYVTIAKAGYPVITSFDGINWTVQTAAYTGISRLPCEFPTGGSVASRNYYTETATISSLIYANNMYVAVGKGDPYYSADGINWETTTSPQRCYYGSSKIAYGGGIFVASDMDVYTVTSYDGKNWEIGYFQFNRRGTINCGPPHIIDPWGSYTSINSITYGNGIFLTLGAMEALARSDNGKDWEILKKACPAIADTLRTEYHSAFYDGNRFVLAANNGIYTTENGSNFELISKKSWPLRNDVSMAYNGNIYITVNGTEIGTLAKGVSVINPKQNPKSYFNFNVRQKGKTLSFTLPFQHTNPRINIHNIAGKRQNIKPVFHSDGTVSISTSHLAKGIYVLSVNGEKQNWQKQTIVK